MPRFTGSSPRPKTARGAAPGTWAAVAAGLLLATAACGDADAERAPGPERPAAPADAARVAPPDEARTALSGIPMGWEIRLDRPNASPADFRVEDGTPDGELRVRTGPAGILYRPADAVSEGSYTLSATFIEYGAPPDHREAYGIVFGGADLQSPSQRYSYFLVRADGRFLVKRRQGDRTSDVMGWTQAEAVNRQADAGRPLENRLEVRVQNGTVRFLVNGTEVAARPASELDAHGIAGLRVNHNLDVGIRDWTVEG